jgi:hypothetical protein
MIVIFLIFNGLFFECIGNRKLGESGSCLGREDCFLLRFHHRLGEDDRLRYGFFDQDRGFIWYLMSRFSRQFTVDCLML